MLSEEFGKTSEESGSQSTSDKTSQGPEVVVEGTARRRKPRKRSRSCSWPWLELVLFAFSTNIVSDFLEVPSSHMIVQSLSDVGSSLSRAPFLGWVADGIVAQLHPSTLCASSSSWASLRCIAGSLVRYSMGSLTDDFDAEPS
eukprot:5124917-Amphidinium_carterae.1